MNTTMTKFRKKFQMQYKIHAMLMASVCIIFSSFIVPAKAIHKQLNIRLNLQEVQILRQILHQIELATQEINPFLEITKQIDQLLETTNLGPGVEASAKRVVLRLTEEAASNLIIFLQRANIPSEGAKQMNTILKKIEKSLPKEKIAKSKKETKEKKAQTISLALTPLEARITQYLLEQIEIAIAETTPFLDIYIPLEKSNKNTTDDQQDIVLQLPLVAPKNLLLFLQRASITGQHAKAVYGIMEKLKQLANSIPYNGA